MRHSHSPKPAVHRFESRGGCSSKNRPFLHRFAVIADAYRATIEALSIPAESNACNELIRHPRVARVAGLSAG